MFERLRSVRDGFKIQAEAMGEGDALPGHVIDLQVADHSSDPVGQGAYRDPNVASDFEEAAAGGHGITDDQPEHHEEGFALAVDVSGQESDWDGTLYEWDHFGTLGRAAYEREPRDL